MSGLAKRTESVTFNQSLTHTDPARMWLKGAGDAWCRSLFVTVRAKPSKQ